MISRGARLFAVLAIVTATGSACGSDNPSSDPPTTNSTSIPVSTTSGSPGTTPDITTTSTAAPSTAEPDAIARAKVQAALDSLPSDWTGSVASDLGQEGSDGSDIVFAPCLDPEDYDLEQLDSDSAASWELDAEGPSTGSPLGGQQVSIEARVFNPDADLDSAYAALEEVLGTDAGRACLAAEVPGQLASDAPEGTEFDASVEGPAVEGADVGARLVVDFSAGGFTGEFYIDLVASRADDRCIVFATFMAFGAPIDADVASDAFSAALAAAP